MNSNMMIKRLAAAAMLVSASAFAQTPANPVAMREALNAQLWMQDSAEYRASTLQAYRLAAARLESLVKAPGTAAVEQAALPAADYAKKPPVIVFDIDETTLDNGLFDGWQVKYGQSFSSAGDAWNSWVAAGVAPLVPGADLLIKEAQRLGVRVVFMTGRSCDRKAGYDADGRALSCPQRTGSRANLTRALGYEPALEDLSFKYDRPGRDDRDKSARRAELARTHRIVMLVGDDLEDFVSRARYGDAEAANWGSRWVVLPNPAYGNWTSRFEKLDEKYAAVKAMNYAGDVARADTLRAPKVVIISMFGPEAEPWIAPLALTEEIRVDGLSPDYPAIRCNRDDVCLLTTGMGHTNAAASTMALIASKRFDLTKTWFLVAGIAGIDPHRGTIGSAAWARWLVDFGIAHEIDPREAPKGWKTGYFGVLTKGPGEKPKFDYRTEVFQLDEALLQKALALSGSAVLEDSPKAQAYRQRYRGAPANQPPRVIQCDTAAGDTWFHGHRLGEHASEWTRLLTDGQGVYCTTQQEDNATANVLQRAEASGLVDAKRLAVLRTGSNFDRPHPGQTAIQSLTSDSGGFPIATANLVKAGKPLVDDIVARWALWKNGVPKD
ncbi:hypothetical protein BH09PSE6_BH09PSE6_05700 [soil metagenome]